MEELPIFINVLFVLTVLATITWFYFATRSKKLLIGIIAWTVIQSMLGLSELYQNTEIIPPRIMVFGILPTLIFVLLVFLTRRGKTSLGQTNLKTLTYFHSIRIPVEITLSLLYNYGVLSIYTTYEGTNFDILSGLSAPLIAFLCFRNIKVKRKLLLTWNIICLILLLNVVVTAVFAFPSPFQQLAFDQPNLAPLYFPFNLLPTVVVPLVLFGHLIAIKQLIKPK